MSDSNQQHEGERGNVVDQVADLLMKEEPSVEEEPKAEKVHRPNDDDLVDDSEESEGVEAAIKNYQAERQSYYESLSTFEIFGRGWTRRVEETTESALEMI